MLLVVTQRNSLGEKSYESIINLSHVVRISSTEAHEGSQVVYEGGVVRNVTESIDVIKARLDRFIMK